MSKENMHLDEVYAAANREEKLAHETESDREHVQHSIAAHALRYRIERMKTGTGPLAV